mgnify:CR=1 FL=1
MRLRDSLPDSYSSFVSIHAPREGCDFCVSVALSALSEFQFTHPGRGATAFWASLRRSRSRFNSRTPGGVRLRRPRLLRQPKQVSIHAPREGCDYGVDYRTSVLQSFNSRTPGGVRLVLTLVGSVIFMFQFTHPGRGATVDLLVVAPHLRFQFTHPGRGATRDHSPPPQH